MHQYSLLYQWAVGKCTTSFQRHIWDTLVAIMFRWDGGLWASPSKFLCCHELLKSLQRSFKAVFLMWRSPPRVTQGPDWSQANSNFRSVTVRTPLWILAAKSGTMQGERAADKPPGGSLLSIFLGWLWRSKLLEGYFHSVSQNLQGKLCREPPWDSNHL